MWWASLSIISGLFDAIMFALMKKLKGINNSVVVWVQYAFALPFLLVALYFYFPQKIDNNVYVIIITNSILLLISTYFLVKAAQISDLSVSVPLLSFTPLFLLFLSYIILKETPTLYGFVGVMLIAIGAYVINITDFRNGILEPLKSLVANKGSLYVIIVAFIWSITANLFKLGILASNPIFYSALVYLAISLFMLPAIFLKPKNNFIEMKSNFNLLFILGLSGAAMIITSSVPMLYAIVPYVISLKRSSAIFSVLIGYYLLKEKNMKNALAGATIMLIGGVLITLF